MGRPKKPPAAKINSNCHSLASNVVVVAAVGLSVTQPKPAKDSKTNQVSVCLSPTKTTQKEQPRVAPTSGRELSKRGHKVAFEFQFDLTSIIGRVDQRRPKRLPGCRRPGGAGGRRAAGLESRPDKQSAHSNHRGQSN